MDLSKLLSVFERLLSLTVVFLLLVATVLWGGKLFGHEFVMDQAGTAQPSTVVAAPMPAQLRAMNVPDARLEVRDSASWNVYNSAGTPVGVVLSSQPFSLEITGFGGPTPLYIYVDASDRVCGLAMASNSETPSFLEAASEPLFNHWVGRAVSEVAAKRVDAVSGATYTSKSLIHNVKLTLNAYINQTAGTVAGEPAIGWGRTIAVLVVLLAGGVVAWRFRRVRWLRLAILALNVGVTGFWAGQFLSVTLLRQWLADGFSPLLYLPAMVLLCVAVVMPFVGRRRYYCTWVCPYGSLQQLAWQVPVPKLRLGDRAMRIMRHCRTAVLMVLLFTLWTGYGMFLLDYEPFPAFLVTVAPPVVVVLAALFVVFGLFVPSPWCRALCPMGELLELAEAGRYRKSGKNTPGRPSAASVRQ